MKRIDDRLMDNKLQLIPDKVPRHVAIIMDGNGRWAKTQGKPRVFGHRQGVKSVREITRAAVRLGLEYLTLYAFSTENWNRPKFEVDALMRLLVSSMNKEIKLLHENEVRLEAVGELSLLPKPTYKALMEGIRSTAHYNSMTMVLALSYSSRWEITEAAKKMARKVKAGELDPEAIDSDLLQQHMATAAYPDPELLIRTSGESRLSNFLLWQAAYAELYFTSVPWPAFTGAHFEQAIIDYQHRQRRFGMTSEQIV